MTKWPTDSLVGSIDRWCCPPNYYVKADADAAIARGEQVWLYASARPMTPADVTDEYGMAWRLKAWIGHQRQIPVWFTWEATHWDSNGNEVGGWGTNKNVWIDPETFKWDPNHTGVAVPSGIGNGDGTLFYPGQDVLFPDQDRGYAGPVASIRMKMYRRGIQDVEYMWLAEQAGHAADTQALIAEHRAEDPVGSADRAALAKHERPLRGRAVEALELALAAPAVPRRAVGPVGEDADRGLCRGRHRVRQ